MSSSMKYLLCLLTVSLTSAKLVQVAELFRHGSRYAIESGFINSGELLPTGMRQHYNLGRMIRKEYIERQHFLSESFNHNEIRVRSTDVNRTLQSVQSQLLGIYPNGPKIPTLKKQYLLPPYKGASNFLDSKYALPEGRQVIPIHVEPDHFQVLSPDCVNQNELTKQDMENLASLSQQFEDVSKEDRINLCKKFQIIKCDNLEDVSDFYTDYKSNIFEGKVVPTINEEDDIKLSKFKSFSMLRDFGGPLISKYLGQPFYIDIINTFKAKIQNPLLPLKYAIYSAHDTNVIRYAAILDLISVECLISQAQNYDPNLQCQDAPDFAASMIFELHQDDVDSSFYVMVKYNGNYQKICRGIYECPIETFEREVRNVIATEEEFVQVCGENPYREAKEESYLQYVVYAQGLLIIALIVMVGKIY